MNHMYKISLTLFFILIAGCDEMNTEKRISSSSIVFQDNSTNIIAVESKQQAKYPSQEKIDAQQTLIAVSKKIHCSYPKYTFKMLGKEMGDGSFFPSRIQVTDSSNGKRVQNLKAKDRFDNDGRGLIPLFTDIEFTDLNQDGYLDMMIITEMGASGNYWGAVYLYMPELKRFKYREDLSRLSGIRLDPQTKRIVTYWRMEWCSEFSEHFTMNKNGRLILNKVEWTEMSSMGHDKVCLRITGIPSNKRLTNLGYSFYHGDKDYDSFLQKNIRIIRKDVVYGSLDAHD